MGKNFSSPAGRAAASSAKQNTFFYVHQTKLRKIVRREKRIYTLILKEVLEGVYIHTYKGKAFIQVLLAVE